MKAHVADYQTRTICVRLVAQDGTTLRWTTYPIDLVMSNSQSYLAGSGFEWTGYGATSSMSPDSVNLQGIVSSAIGMLDRDQIAVGKWDNARAYVFATSWTAPVEDEEEVTVFTFGQATLRDDTWVVEFMGLLDALNQTVGPIYSAQCQNTLFDQTLGGSLIATSRSRCTGPRSAPDGPQLATFLRTGTVTAVTSQYQFQDTARTEADEYFTSGQMRFTSGANAGLKAIQIKQSTSGGQIVLHEAAYYPIQLGDAYEITPGCRKRLVDCQAWNNVKNMNAFPHIPAPTEYTQIGRGA